MQGNSGIVEIMAAEASPEREMNNYADAASKNGPTCLNATSRRSNNIFDFLRLIAAITVICGHSFTHFNIPVLGRWVNGRFEPGMYWFIDGVPLFFMLSGFLVFRSCQKCFDRGQPLKNFYWNRALRVVPAIYLYVFAVTLWLLLIGLISFQQLGTSQFVLWAIRNLALMGVGSPAIFSAFGIGSINGSLWTIPVEVSFYVVAPAFVLFWRRFGARRGSAFLVTCAIGGLVLRWLFFLKYGEGLELKVIDLTVIPYFIWFALGIVMGEAWPHVNKSYVCLVSCVVGYFAIRWTWFNYRESAGPIYTVAFGLPLAYSVLWFGFNGWRRLNNLTRRGDVSYGIYIWHMIVINSLLYFHVGASLKGSRRLLLVGLTLIVTYLIGLASWKLVEERALKLKPYSSRPAEQQFSTGDAT